MLIIAKLAPGREAYYERSVAAGLDDYDAGRGESPGVWVGRGAASLGLEGVVSDGQLGALIRGLDPATHQRLRRHPKARVVTRARENPEGGERRAVQRRLSAVAGFDLVFSAPKSVSILHALGEQESRRATGAAHLAAWQASLAYLEEEACVIRRGAQGLLHEHAQGFVAAAYEHRTSRAQEPHLHTHVIAANLARSPSDGKWRALDGGAILRHYKRAASYLYQAHLRFELSRLLGVEWEAPVKGSAELKGVSRAVIDEFSTRSRQLAGRMDEKGLASFAAARLAGLETRQPKQQVDLGQLREDWSARAAEHGLETRSLARLVHRSRYREPTPRELARLAERLLGQDGLTEPETVFSEPELVMAWAEGIAQGAPAERIRALTGRFLEIDRLERVGVQATPGRPARYSAAALAEGNAPTLEDRVWFAPRRDHAPIGRSAQGRSAPEPRRPALGGLREDPERTFEQDRREPGHSETARRNLSDQALTTSPARDRRSPDPPPPARERRGSELGL